MEEKVCQSCGMPMGATDETFGTNADGSKSTDYCAYCYENGAFIQDVSLPEMIDICVPHMVEGGMNETKARQMMQAFLPTLKRWR